MMLISIANISYAQHVNNCVLKEIRTMDILGYIVYRFYCEDSILVISPKQSIDSDGSWGCLEVGERYSITISRIYSIELNGVNIRIQYEPNSHAEEVFLENGEALYEAKEIKGLMIKNIIKSQIKN